MSLRAHRRWLSSVVVVCAAHLIATLPASAAPQVRRANGANAAAIQATVDQFRTDLGGANNGVGGNPATGRREINWDGVPAGFSSPNNLPPAFFNVNSPRGVVFGTNGTAFQVSGTPAEFGNFNATYPDQFLPFSPAKLFTAVGSNVTDVTFFVPGTTRPASVSGFGVVFTDVDVFGSTTVEFFDERGRRMGPVLDSTTAYVGTLSFVGVSFDAGERIARVRITSGNAILSSGVADGAVDVVAMDDFIYGEPQAMTSPVAIDTLFAGGGRAEISLGGPDAARSILVQGDGKIVVVGLAGIGSNQAGLVRLNPDGTRDTTFDGDGRASYAHGISYQPRAAALQSDGRIVVVGDSQPTVMGIREMAVLRVLPNGSLDPDFDGDGRQVIPFGLETFGYAVAVQPDGKIVVAGSAAGDAVVVRLNADGSLDTSFNPQPTATIEDGNGRRRVDSGGTESFRAIALQPTGEIVLGGAVTTGQTQMLAARLLPDGRLDPTFDGDGLATVSFTDTAIAHALLLLPDGHVLLGGTWSAASPDWALARLRPDGSLDTTFNPQPAPTPNTGNGRLLFTLGGSDELRGMALQRDGRVLLAGWTNAGGGVPNNPTVMRLTPDGQLDASFAPGGGATYEFGDNEQFDAVAVLPNARIVAAGRRGADYIVVRLLGGPTPGVYITTPSITSNTTATSPLVALRGTAGDDVAVTQVSWTSDRGFAGVASGTASWDAEVPLVAGANIISVTAVDGNGNSSTDTITITVTEFLYYLAEGATGPFFDLDIPIVNTSATEVADVRISYLKPDGTTVPKTFLLGPRSRATVKADLDAGIENTAVSAVVRSANAVPLAVERTMFWDGSYYGGHTGNAVDGPRTRWLFGEGNQGFFQTYVLLANANPSPATATVTFLVEGGPNVVKTIALGPTSRENVYAGSYAELINKSFSIVVTSTLPIIAERAMYFGSRTFEGGHESAGVPEAATSWFHAEGATGSYFDTYILVGNPNPVVANLTITFLKGDGTSLVRSKQVPANGRFTMHVDGEDPALADTAVSTTVVSDIPVVSERAMYWSGNSSTWFEAHNSFGVTRTGQKWALAEGRVGDGPEFETYVLIANPATTAAQVRATFMRSNGEQIVKTYDVQPTSRFNIWVNAMVPELQNEHFGVLIEVLNGVDVAVERALYWKSGGVGFAGGTNATGIRVP